MTDNMDRQDGAHGTCCNTECNNPAEFAIYGSSELPDDDTYACEAHVGGLIGSLPGVPENESWTVVPL